jgi:NAD(P)-dependent dehydrogenase (short-subunit alcohol dehydrogenase family)
MDKNLLISGCSTGIGRACALYFSNKGYHVFAGVRKEFDADSLREADTSGNLEPVMLDVTNEFQMGELKAELNQRIGGTGLVGLINNAGIGEGGVLEFVDPNKVRRILAVNLMGPLLLTQAFLPLIRTGRGRIVTVGSLAGKIASPFTGSYNMSKFGIEAFSDALRAELAPHGIHVSLIEPGMIDTPPVQGFEAQVEENLESLSEKGREYYGDHIRKYVSFFLQMASRALPPQAVVDVIEHALEANRPKTRYVVTIDAKISVFIKWLLPDKAFDFIAARTIA